MAAEETVYDIVLIGPMGAGKSTQGQLLSDALGLPRAQMDTLRFDYYKEIGYDETLAGEKAREGGFPGILAYWKPFEAYSVGRLLTEHRDCVIDFGAGHSVYDEMAHCAQVKAALAPYPNVFLLLPAPDFDESVRLLKARRGFEIEGGEDFDEYCVKHPLNHELARFTVYTDSRTPEQTRDEILSLRVVPPAPAA